MNQILDVAIIGGGLSGLSVGNFLKNFDPHSSFQILEASSRTGGVMRTEKSNGFLAEWGAHGFLDNSIESKKLIELSKSTHLVEKAPLKQFVRYICLDGKLNLIPQTPPKIVMAPIMPLWAKIRVLFDIFKKSLPGEPTVAQWGQYRFGQSILPFLDAVFTGTYAGDINRLSINAVFPGLRAVEAQHGSIIRGLIAKARASRHDRKKSSEKLELPAMTSFQGGMQTIVDGLAQAIKDHIALNSEVFSIQLKENIWEIKTSHGVIYSRDLVISTPINMSLKLLESLDEKAKSFVVPEAKLATVIMGFDDSAQIPFGFGYLAPEKENRFALGALFSSHMFPRRAPQNQSLIEVLVGGRRHPEKLLLSDDEIIEKCYEDVSQLISIPKKPIYSKVLRVNAGIPQLELGYESILDWRKNLLHKHKNLHVAGFGWDGIGINDMCKAAYKVAESLTVGKRTQQQVEVKGVYF